MKVGDDWIRMAVSGTTCLPCLFCIAAYNGREVEEWKSVRLDHSHLLTRMDSRIRQHLIRTHDLRSRNPVAEQMKSRAKELLCEILHEQPTENLLSSPQVKCILLL